MKVLIVDDEKLIRDVIKEYCLAEKYEVIEASNGIEALNLYDKADIIIMDVMMPVMDGLTAYKKIKEKKDIPTIILSARKEEYDILNGFDIGIDDYITKPFSPKELIARIKAISKRYMDTSPQYKYKDLVLDYNGKCLIIDNKNIQLTPKEYDLIFYMIKNKGIVLSREQILNKVWNYEYYGEDRTIDTHIKLLRKKMGKYNFLIKTIRGMGYKFDEK